MSNPERWQRTKPLPADIEERLAQLPCFLAQEGVVLAYLFGSLAHEDAPGRRQDVDLALLTSGRPVYELRDAISNRLGTQRLDLIDLHRASPVLRFEIISTGRPLYVRDEEERLEFELAALRQYRDTAPRRRRQSQLLRERMQAWLSKEAASKND